MSEAHQPARVGFVGCGSHANHRLYPAIKLVPQIDLVAVCDVDTERARHTATRWGVPHVHDDVDQMIDAHDLDAAIVCGDPQMHCAVGQQCLERGLHIYVEKPSAITSAQAQTLADVATANGRKGICGFMKRYAHIYRAAKAITQTDGFGPINMAEVRFTQGPYPKLWGIDQPLRAFLIGQLVHIFDITRFLCGDVASVHARLNEVGEGEGVYAVNLTFAHGGVGLMSLNAVASDAWHFDETIRLTGYRQWLEARDQKHLTYHPVDGFLPEPLRKQHAFKQQTFHYDAPHMLAFDSLDMGGYVGEMRDLARIAVTDEQPTASLQDCVEALKIAEAIWRSAQSGVVEPVG